MQKAVTQVMTSFPSPTQNLNPQSNDRLIRGELSWALRTTPRFAKAKGSNPAAVAGLRYEHKVQKSLALRKGFVVEPNPWFAFQDSIGQAMCSPDAIITDLETGQTIIVEVKLKYVPTAIGKLRGLYIPVVQKALGLRTTPLALVVAKHMVPDGPFPGFGIAEALALRPPVLQWLGTGRIAS